MNRSTSDADYHLRADPHRRGTQLSDVILGGQDGLVNVLGVVLGVAAATGSSRVVLAAGLAATFAESVSMAAVAYTTMMADGARYQSEREREYRHIRRVPELERDEIRAIFRRKGFEGALLERIVDTITADPDVWVAAMMTEEHHLAPITRRHALRSALIVGLAAIVGSLIPLAPFAVLTVRLAIWVGLATAAAALFVLGAYKARSTVGHPARSGLEIAAIGLASALAGYAAGALFQVPVVP